MNKNSLLHVGSPNIGDREKFHKYVDEIFDRRWLTNRGECVQKLEARLAEYLGVKHCITMCNGTVALEIAIRALDLSGEVIIPSLTFVATAHALQWQQIKPVFCDIDPNSYNIDPCEVEKHITEKTTGILGVHLYGRPCEIERLQQIADSYGIKLLFDAAHAFGCSHNGKRIGNFGVCEVFSFHATKVFNTFEGGAVATNNDELAAKIRLMQNFGFSGVDNVVHIGTNGKMCEVCAAMGIVNLDDLHVFMEVNRKNYQLYKEKISLIKGLRLIDFDELESYNAHYIVLEVDGSYPLCRDEIINELVNNNILARRYFWPGCHNMEPYRSSVSGAVYLLPKTDEVSARIVVLPNGGQVDVERVCKVLSLHCD